LIGTALALQVYVGAFFANGARPDGIVRATNKLTSQQGQALREMWQGVFGGARQAHRVAILDSGLDYKSIATENDSAQVNEMLTSLIQQIAGVFRVPPFKIGDLSKATYSNVEASALDYVTSTLDPYFEAWEQAIRRDLLTTRQFGQFTAEFDRHALIRSDMKSLSDSLSVGINTGYLSPNDARKALGMNPIPDGDIYRVNTALAPIAQGEPHVA
jgi:HK97 family phage portal protein